MLRFFSNKIACIYPNVSDSTPEKPHQIMTVFYEMIWFIINIIRNKKLGQIVKELFITGRLNIIGLSNL